jgi:hypothetical protein
VPLLLLIPLRVLPSLRMPLLALALALELLAPSAMAAEPYVPKGPKFSWDTMPSFFHSSNSSGLINQKAIEMMAKFPMVTVEKFQGPCGNSHSPLPSPACDQEAQIIAPLRQVKALNPNVSTIFCASSFSACLPRGILPSSCCSAREALQQH